MIGKVDEVRINQFYAVLATMQVPLDPDPISMGPGALQGKTELLRRHLDRWEKIYEDLSQEIQIIKRQMRKALGEYDILEQRALASDPEVRARNHLKDRKAVFATKNPAIVKEIQDLKSTVEDLEEFRTVLTVKKRDLMDISNRLKDQMVLIKEELQLGRRWGSAPTRKDLPPPSGATPPHPGGEFPDVASIVREMDTLMEQAEDGEEAEVLAEPVETQPDPSDDDLDSLLNSIDVPDVVTTTKVPEDFNLDDLL